MHNLGDDKELDRLSREAAGRYTPPGAPDWDALSSELDKVMPAEEKKRRVIFWWLLPVLLAGGATAYWLTHNNNDKPVTGQPAAITVAKETTPTPAQGTVSVKKETPQVTAATEERTPAGTNPLANNKITEGPSVTKTASPAANSSSVAVRRKNNGALRNAFAVTDNLLTNNTPSVNIGATLTTSKLPVKKENVQTGDEPSKENTVATVDPIKEKETAKTTTDQSQADNSNTHAVKEDKTEPTVETPVVAAEPAAPKKESIKLAPRGKGFSFGVLAGVDESTVKFKYGNNAGYNLGFAAGYHFNDKLSVHTGAIFTEKKYKVAGADFTAPKGTPISYYKLDNVDGYCRMWEFPLLVRYTISQGKKSSAFVSTGLSSYYMTEEHYNYFYYTALGALASRTSEYESHDTHILSVLHLSAGFESRMSRKLSVLIEPYAKLPLGGVGFGDIMLSSFGLNFSVQYRQPAKK
jgi:hypothetical protein